MAAPGVGNNNNNNNNNGVNLEGANDINNDNNNNLAFATSTTALWDNNADTDALVLWRERERRQRSVRVLLMFLLMLLFLDGDENQSQQHHQHNRNRNPYHNNYNNNNLHKKRIRGGGSPNGRGADGNNGLPSMWLAPDVFDARQLQDHRLHQITLKHPRYQALLLKNNPTGNNNNNNNSKNNNNKKDASSQSSTPLLHDYYTQSVLPWAEQQAEQEQDEFGPDAAAADGGRVHGLVVRGTGRSSSSMTTDRMILPQPPPSQRDPEQDRKVYHYPWNSTGFYRGEWTRKVNQVDQLSGRTTGSNNLKQSTEELVQPSDSVTSSTATEASSTIASSHEEKTTLSSSSSPKGNKTAKSLASKNAIVSDAPSLESAMLKILRERREPVGVFLLPPHHEIMLRDDNNLTSRGYEHITIDSAGHSYYNNKPSPQQQHPLPQTAFQPVLASVERTATSSSNLHAESFSHPYPPQLPKSVTLTRDSGRAAFQLFSRSIPAMKELSLVDGFVKLYDSNSPGYSTRKDILLRVRGVIIHNIGRLSLVANANANRSAFVLDHPDLAAAARQDQETVLDESTAGTVTDQPHSSRTRASQHKSVPLDMHQRHRRLLEALENAEQADMNIVREDALALYADQVSSTKSEWTLTSLTETGEHDQFEVEEENTGPNAEDDDDDSDDDTGNDENDNAESEDGIGSVTNSEDKTDEAADVLRSVEPKSSKKVRKLVSDEEEEGGGEQEHVPDTFPDATDGGDFEDASPGSSTSSSFAGVSAYFLQRSGGNAAFDRNESGQEVAGRKLVDSNKTQKSSMSSSKAGMVGNKSSGAPGTQTSGGKSLVAKKLPLWSDIVLPYPFVRDDKDESIRRTRTPAARRMPPREQLLEANAASCEFEISMDVKEVEWTVGAWRTLVTRRVKEAHKLNPHAHTNDEDTEGEDKDSESQARGARPRVLSRGSKRLKPPQDEALVMTMVGVIRSPNCGFEATLNATAQRTDWDATTSKAINYSFYMMLVCLTQILVLLRQLLHSQSQAAATRVSLLCIGWQTIIDALVCFAHIYLSLALQPLFTAFASVAFFKLLIFCVIEMKYMAMIIQARNSSNGGQTAEALRRQVAMLHLRFYVALFATFLLTFYIGDKYRTVYILALYSFWIPQIILNVITEAKTPLHKNFIYGMSISRLVAPIYSFGVSNNFLKEVYPDSPTDSLTCQMLVLWVGIQTAILIAQGKYGARFMIPARFLPPKFDYSRPLPPSMLPPGMTHSQPNNTDTLGDAPRSGDTQGLLPNEAASTAPRDRHTTAVTTRNRMRGNRAHRHHESTMVVTSDAERAAQTEPTLDCSICYDAIDVRNRRGYMLAPCDHIFHRDCLVQWMDVKMECPICRTELPAL